MILRAWHYYDDYAQYTVEEIIQNKQQADPFLPFSSLEKDLNEVFCRNYNPGQYVT